MNQPIRLGLIGCGGIVQRAHAPAFASMQGLVQVVALADPIESNLTAVGQKFGVPTEHQYPSYRDMLAKAKIDAVSIATPHFLHAEQVIASANAGVAVISEKPMATSLDEADAILEAVERNGVPYAVVHNLLFSPAMKHALSLLGLGQFGEPLFGRSQAMFVKPKHLSPDDWRHSRAKGGGCIIDSAYHEIYAVSALMLSPVKYIEARVKTLYYEALDVDDTAVLLLEHENGAVSTVTASWCAASHGNDSGRWCEAHTTEGTLRVNHRPNKPVLRFSRTDGWQDIDLPGMKDGAKESATLSALRFAEATGHAGFFAATFEALATGAKVPVTGENARRNLAIIEAARQATIERRAVTLA